jgi:hypothetical protein
MCTYIIHILSYRWSLRSSCFYSSSQLCFTMTKQVLKFWSHVQSLSLSLGPWRYKNKWQLCSGKRCVLQFVKHDQLFLFSGPSGNNFRVNPHLPTTLGVSISSFRQWRAFVKEKCRMSTGVRRKCGMSETVLSSQSEEIFVPCESWIGDIDMIIVAVRLSLWHLLWNLPVNISSLEWQPCSLDFFEERCTVFVHTMCTFYRERLHSSLYFFSDIQHFS